MSDRILPERLRRALAREMTGGNRLGAWMAILTCPCHVPMLLFLLGGTALGAALAAVRIWLYAGFAIAFAAGIALMLRAKGPACDVRLPEPPARSRARS